IADACGRSGVRGRATRATGSSRPADRRNAGRNIVGQCPAAWCLSAGTAAGLSACGRERNDCDGQSDSQPERQLRGDGALREPHRTRTRGPTRGSSIHAAMRARPLRVLMTTEGTYPFHGGGVSTWCDALISHLPEIDYTLLAVAMHPYVQKRYQLPANLRRLVTVPLWGIEEPAEYSWDVPFSELLRRRWSTTSMVIGSEFIPALGSFFELALQGGADTDALAAATLHLHEYFVRYDY